MFDEEDWFFEDLQRVESLDRSIEQAEKGEIEEVTSIEDI